MAVKVGSFAKSTAAATASQAVTGVGFTPKALILWTAGAPTAVDTWTVSHRTSFGVTAGAANSYSVSAASVDAGASSNTSRRQTAKALTIIEWGESLIAECDLASFDADGFTLSWTTNNASAYIINYMAIGGTDVQAKAARWQESGDTTAVTGIGFEPTFAFHLTAIDTDLDGSSTQGVLSIGAMDGTNEWSVGFDARDAAATSNTTKYHMGNYCVFWRYSTNQGAWNGFQFTSFDADGFTLDTQFASSSSRYYVSLCLAGASFACGDVVMDADSGDQAITGLGFEPEGLMLFSAQASTRPTTAQNALDHGTLSWGATDGTTSVAGGLKDEDALADTDVNSIMWNDRVMVEMDDSGQDITRSATLASLDADGFTLTWDNSGAANYLYYMALTTSPATAATAVKMMHYKRLRQ